MKTLESSFTTPEESMQLLELGVPAWTADCYYTKEEIEGNKYWFDLHIKREYKPHTSLHASTIWKETLPCWSVGRLQQIYAICFTGEPFKMWYDDNFFIPENVIGGIEEHKEELDFSKLKEYEN